MKMCAKSHFIKIALAKGLRAACKCAHSFQGEADRWGQWTGVIRPSVFSPAGPWKPSRDPFESTLPPSETSRTAPSLRGEASERLYSRRRATPSHMVRPKHAQIFGKTAALDGQQPADLGR
jgi:hypothetical protein